MNEDEPNPVFTCPITNDIFTDPVIAEDGHTYERAAITDWLKKNSISPLSRLEIKVENLKPNLVIKAMMDQFINFDNEAKNTKKINSEFLGKFQSEINKLEENNVLQKEYNKILTHLNISAFTCPITNNIFSEPVLASDGYTYEKKAIQDWFAKSDVSPKTNQKLQNKTLVSNHATKGMIDLLKQQEKDWKSVKQTEKKYLYVFAPKVRELLHLDVMNLQKNAAIKLLTNWDGSANIDISKQTEDIMKRQTQLNTYKLKNDKYQFQIPNFMQTFVGREKQIGMINVIFAKNNYLCLVGSGGMGKSQLAAEYIHRTKFSSVIWLHGENKLLIFQIQTYLLKAFDIDTKNIKNLDDLLKRFYELLGANSLVIIDNIQNEQQVKDFLPKENQTKIIITSRSENWAFPIVKLSQFSQDQTFEYVSKILTNRQDQISHQETNKLNTLLGGMLLALNVAVATIKQDKQMTIQKYCELFIQRQSQSLQKNPEDPFNYVYTTLILALHDLKKENNQVDLIMNVICYMAPEQLNKHFAVSFLQQQDPKNFSKTKSKKIKQVFKVLCDFSIISQNLKDENAYSMNRLTQSVIRMIQRATGIFQKYYTNFADWILKNLYYDERSLKDVAKVTKFISHALTVANIENTDFYIQKANLFRQIGYHQFYSIKNYLQAKICFQKGLEILERNQLTDPYLFVILLNDFGSLNGQFGNYHEQFEIHNKALELSEKYFGKNSEMTAQILTNLGDAYGRLGDYQKELSSLLRSLEIKEKYLKLSKGHISLNNTLIHLGTAYGNLGDHKKKKEVLNRALIISQKQYGKNHPNTISIKSNIANANRHLGQNNTNLQVLVDTLKRIEKRLGDNHPDYSLAAMNLAIQYIHIGEYQQALELLQKSLKINQKHYGESNPKTAIVMLNMGTVYHFLGDKIKAKQINDKAYQIMVDYYGQTHPQTLKIKSTLEQMNSQGVLKNMMWDFMQNFTQQKKKKMISDTALLQKETTQYIQSMCKSQDPIKKQAILTAALSASKGSNVDPQQRLIMQIDMLCIQAQRYLQQGRYKNAVINFQKALPLNQKVFGKNDQSMGALLTDLGSAYTYLNQFNKAEDVYTRALIVNEHNFGKNDFMTAITLTNLGVVYGELGNQEKNKEVTERAYNIFLKQYGHNHQYTKDALFNLNLLNKQLSNNKSKINNNLPIKADSKQTQDQLVNKRIRQNYGQEFIASYGMETAKQLDKKIILANVASKMFGQNSMDTFVPVYQLSKFYFKLLYYQQGMEQYNRALAIQEIVMGKNHPKTVQLRNNLKKLLNPQGPNSNFQISELVYNKR